MNDQPSITFTAFVMSLATTAAVHFGDVKDPGLGEAQTNLPGAAQMIDILSLLRDKTKGNLTDDESQLLERLLFELRMRFVEASQGERRIITP
jgi:hypothetical protein